MKTKLAIFLTLIILITSAGSAQAAPAAQTGCGDSYTVRTGDSLRKIAGICETTLANLLAMNPNITNIDRIYVGQRINLAPTDVEGPLVRLEPAEGLSGSQTQVQLRGFPSKALVTIAVADEGGEPFELESIQADVNGSFNLDMLVTGEPGRDWYIMAWLVEDVDVSVRSEAFHILEEQPKEGPVTYVVKRGDSLAKIAKQHNRTVNHLLVANPEIGNPNRIYPGQEILIPGESEQVYTILAERPSEVAQAIANGERWIEVDVAHQTVHAWEGSQLVRSFLVSTGKPSTPTVTGQFNIWVKLRYDDMRGPGYNLKDVPYVMYFYKGYGLHGTYWHNQFGTPRSAGCVNLRTEDAEWLYNFAEVGTLVDVH